MGKLAFEQASAGAQAVTTAAAVVLDCSRGDRGEGSEPVAERSAARIVRGGWSAALSRPASHREGVLRSKRSVTRPSGGARHGASGSGNAVRTRAGALHAGQTRTSIPIGRNLIPFPAPGTPYESGPIRRRERLGGLLNFYERNAA
jgi:hypothetical protein